MNKVKVLGIDYGDRYIGFAQTDPLEIIAYPHSSMRIKSMKEAIEAAEAVVKEYGIAHIVVGLPLMTDGSEGERASKTRAFGRVLSRVTGLEVEYIDERYTTSEAETILASGGVKNKDFKKYTDKLAAQIILESWLRGRRGCGEPLQAD